MQLRTTCQNKEYPTNLNQLVKKSENADVNYVPPPVGEGKNSWNSATLKYVFLFLHNTEQIWNWDISTPEATGQDDDFQWIGFKIHAAAK